MSKFLVHAGFKHHPTVETLDASVTVPPDGGYGWVITFGSLIVNIIFGIVIYSHPLYSKSISVELNKRPVDITVAMSILDGVFNLTGPITSSMVNHLGFRISCCIGTIIAAGGLFILSRSYGIVTIYLGFAFVTGFGFGLMCMAATISVGYYFEKWRAIAISIAVSGSGLGTFVGPLLNTEAISHFGWRKAILLETVAVLGFGMFVSILLRPLKPTLLVVVDKEVVREKIQKKAKEPPVTEPTTSVETKPKKVEEPEAITVKELTEEGVESKRLMEADGTEKEPKPSATKPEELTPFSVVLLKPPKETKEERKNREVREARERWHEANKYKKWKSLPEELKEKKTEASDQPPPPPPPTTTPTDLPRYSISVSRPTEPPVKTPRKAKQQQPEVTKTAPTARPMDRDDIFLGANLDILPQYKKNEELGVKLEIGATVTDKDASRLAEQNIPYHMEVTRVPKTEPHRSRYGWLKHAFAHSVNFKLLDQASFAVLAISGMFMVMGSMPVFMFIVSRAVNIFNLAEDDAILLVSIIGMANFAGRLFCGFISTIPNVKALAVMRNCTFICGSCTILSEFMCGDLGQYIFALIFGITVASTSSLITIVIVDLVGLNKLSSAFGLVLMFKGLGAFLTAGLCAVLLKPIGTVWIFRLTGIVMLIASSLLTAVKPLAFLEHKRTKKVKDRAFERERNIRDTDIQCNPEDLEEFVKSDAKAQPKKPKKEEVKEEIATVAFAFVDVLNVKCLVEYDQVDNRYWDLEGGENFLESRGRKTGRRVFRGMQTVPSRRKTYFRFRRKKRYVSIATQIDL